MASIFRKDDNFVDKPKRNAFDMSFQTNLTTKFGVLKPVYCQEVIPGDSFKIRPDFALRFLPMVFPVQTRMKAHLHFFYVRNRTLWKDWMDFIGKTKSGLVPPYIQISEQNKAMLEVGGLFDSFGVPVVSNSRIPLSITETTRDSSPYLFNFVTGKYYDGLYPQVNWDFVHDVIQGDANQVILSSSEYRADSAQIRYMDFEYNLKQGSDLEFDVSFQDGRVTDLVFVFQISYRDGGDDFIGYYNCGEISSSTDRVIALEGGIFDGAVNIVPLAVYANTSSEWQLSYSVIPSEQPNGVRLVDLPIATISKYFGTNGEPISALPFRAYEAIYNSFYRNAENNPYILNGVPEYNKYIPSYDGSADVNFYEMHNRNWEDDFLTTAVQSPQQGNAPLVGLTASNNTALVIFGNEDGTKTELSVETGDDGEIIAVKNSKAAQDEYANVLANALRDGAVNFGLSINDLRNVNAFQKWLENNIRKGFKYRDQIKGHYGVTVRYDELDMPEFIGGVSRDVSVQQITQTTENQFGNLGDIAGQSYVMGSGSTINHYCDEHGFIIGILSIVPMANYSQLIPKFLIKRDALDYYFPEFGHIGMQPILNKEVTFIEAIDSGRKDDVFGYQRAWFDYLARTDEVHGLFRTSLRQFLIGRTFDSLPDLSAAFSTIQNDQLSNIFYVDDDEDKILGQIYFDVTAVRPIPIYGIPSLE